VPGFETGTKYMLVLASLFSCLKYRVEVSEDLAPSVAFAAGG